MSPTAAGVYGLAGTVLFTIALITFAESYPGYSHATKAVSELGAIGAPHGMAWNIIGFILPGLLLAFHGWGLGRVTQSPLVSVLLAISGLAFASTSIPADMSDMNARHSAAGCASGDR